MNQNNKRLPGAITRARGIASAVGNAGSRATGARRPAGLALAVLAAALLAACATPVPVDPAALPAVPAAFRETGPQRADTAPAEADARGDWWTAFNDPALDDLVDRALAGNASLARAAANLARAHALLGATRANELPQVDVGAGASRGITTLRPGVAASAFSLGASLSYEVDLFGRLRAATDAAALDAEASTALLRDARLLVEAEVATTYLALRATDDERRLVRDTLASYRDTLRFTERRNAAGDVGELDVVRVRTQVAATEAEALALDARRATLEHALAALLGEAPATFTLAPADWTSALPAIPAGVPSTVLARRPDVTAAQRSLAAAQLRAGIARTAWLPSLSLTASGGQASPELSDLFTWPARVWGIGAGLVLPVFDGGRRDALARSAQADLDGVVADYRDRVLVAFRDVEDQLSTLRLLDEQAEAQARAVQSASRATALSQTRYRNGLVSQLDLLDAQRSEFAARRGELQVRSAQYQTTVRLVRALGGGWDGGRG